SGSIYNNVRLIFQGPSVPSRTEIANVLLNAASSVTNFDIEGSSITVDGISSSGVSQKISLVTASCLPPISPSNVKKINLKKLCINGLCHATCLMHACTLQQPLSDAKTLLECRSFSLPQQFTPKYKEPGNHNSGEDMVRTYLWRCQFVLPLVSLGLVVLAGLTGFVACLCQSLTPTLGIGVLHLLAGLCTLATVCCYLAGMDLLHRVSMLPDKVDGSLGWSLYLALISSPLHMMAAALLVWAARSHSQNYYRMTAYRVA
ncbi:putative claudin domain-containing protein 1-like, partial [Scophthalmus maximus]